MLGPDKLPEAGAHWEISWFLGGPVRPLIGRALKLPQWVWTEPGH